MHIRGRIVTERTGTDEKRIRVGRALGDRYRRTRPITPIFLLIVNDILLI